MPLLYFSGLPEKSKGAYKRQCTQNCDRGVVFDFGKQCRNGLHLCESGMCGKALYEAFGWMKKCGVEGKMDMQVKVCRNTW